MMLYQSTALSTAGLIIVSGLLEGVLCFSECEPPQSTSVNYNIVPSNDNDTMRYLLHCDDNKKLYPLGDKNDLFCEGGKWTHYGSVNEIDMNEIQCMKVCTDPEPVMRDRGSYTIDSDYVVSLSRTNPGGKTLTVNEAGRLYYIPGVVVILTCKSGYNLSSTPVVTCGEEGAWIPPIASCIDSKEFELSEKRDTSDPVVNYQIIIIIVSVVAVLLTVVIMLTICIRAKWRVVCRKRRATTSHPDDINYPHGYTQLGSGSMLPSYAEAMEDYGDRENTSHFSPYSVYRPTTATALTDYRQLSSMESSSRGESESLSAAGSHRHSLFSGSSANHRYVGDDISDVLLQGDHLSMSDNSTLVTVNTYDSHTASNPSLNNNSRRGVAGSMNSNTATSTDDAPLIVRSQHDEEEINETQSTADC